VEKIRVIIAEDHAVVREGTRQLLEREQDIEVVGEAANGAEALALVERLSPDVAIMDISMPEMTGIEATEKIKAARPATAVLILTAYDDDQYVFALLAAGAAGNTVAHVANKMNEAVAKHGYGEYCRPPYMRVRGHGLGSVSSLPGDIGADNEMALEEGMTFVMHPNQFLPGGGYMMVGEPVVITKTCAEPLTTRYSRLTSIPL